MVLPYPLVESMMMFFIYSFIGWVVEVIYYGVTEGKFINRGFLNGPLCPVYGLGFYTALWFFEPLKSNVALIFFGGATACTVVELITGVILYKIFHLRWWDYSDYKMNLKGFICLRFYIYWGIASTLGIYALHPAVLKFIDLFTDSAKLATLAILFFTLIIDIVGSVSNIIGFSNKLKAFNTFSASVRSASDFIGGNIYGTVDTIIEVETPVKDSYDAYRKLVAEHKEEENELAKKHRQEEREYLNAVFASGKDAAFKTKDMASEKMFGLVSSFNVFDKRLLRIVNPGGRQDIYDKALKTIRFDYFKSTANNVPTAMVAEAPTEEQLERDLNESIGSI